MVLLSLRVLLGLLNENKRLVEILLILYFNWSKLTPFIIIYWDDTSIIQMSVIAHVMVLMVC